MNNLAKNSINNMKKFHLVLYVQNASLKIKKFNTLSAMNKFISDFKLGPDNWIDCTVTGVTGELNIIEPSLKME